MRPDHEGPPGIGAELHFVTRAANNHVKSSQHLAKRRGQAI